MKKRVVARTPASLDILDQAEYYEIQSGKALAARFWKAVDATYVLLLSRPRIGSLSRIPRLRSLGVREFTVQDFPHHIVFYRELPGGIEILRLLHGARDIDALFANDE